MKNGPEFRRDRDGRAGHIAGTDAHHSHPTARRGTPVRLLRYRQAKIIALLFGGYAACYFCRADLSVATPLLIEELGKHGMSHAEALVRMGAMTSFGVLAYALGKLFLGGSVISGAAESTS
jgi:sugar phosphate permease